MINKEESDGEEENEDQEEMGMDSYNEESDSEEDMVD